MASQTQTPKVAKSKPSKMRNRRVYLTPDGVAVEEDHGGPKTKIADSRKEHRRLLTLRKEAKSGQIQTLQCQKRFSLHAMGGKKVCSYVADFVYMRGGVRVVEDVKGMRTAMYKLKCKWMLLEYGITILET